jgi:hypothetical protein
MLKIGTRVQLHAATDAWMQGDRYGEIVGLGKARLYYDSFNKSAEPVKVRPYRVKLDKSGKVRRFHPEWVFEID